jgi:hypothetical protein
MSFENNIKNWVVLDNEIKRTNDKLKTLRDQKNKLNVDITTHITSNNMQNSQVNIGDGRLKFTTVKIQQPLTFTYLEDTLSEIIKDKSQATTILNHLKNKRESKMVPEIKRYYNN